MSLLVSPAALDALFASPRVILCEYTLVDLLTRAVPTLATIVPYRGKTIGERGGGRGIEIAELGLPAALEMIVAPVGCKTARAIAELIEKSGFPRSVPLIEVTDAKARKSALAAAYAQAVETQLAELQSGRAAQEELLFAQRRRIEAQALQTNHMSAFLGMLGFATQELSLEQPVDEGGAFLNLPLSQGLPVLLSEVAGLSIYSAPAGAPQRAAIALEVAGKEVHRQSIELPAGGGWNDIFLPAGFTAHALDAVLKVEPEKGEPRIAASAHAGLPETDQGVPARSAALRIWRNVDPRVHPLREQAMVQLPRPTSVSGNVLNEADILAASGLSRIDQLISLPDDCLVQTHPVPGRIATYVTRDLDITAVSTVEAEISLDHPQASPTKFALFLAPMADDGALHAALKKAIDGYGDKRSRVVSAVLDGGASKRLSLSTAGLDPARRYCLVLAAKPVSQATQFAWAKWRSVTLRTDRKPYRQTYRFAHLASLANQIQNADGPIAEAERGFRELSITEGDRFLQTHPMSDRAVAARLHSFAPKGLLRFWTDISIDHPEASATEFGVLLTPRLVTGEFGRFYEESRFAALADDALHVLPDGSLVKKKLLRPGERGWIDITLLEPLRETCHLYLFVKLRGGSAAFGWCRWHRLAMVILAESSQ